MLNIFLEKNTPRSVTVYTVFRFSTYPTASKVNKKSRVCITFKNSPNPLCVIYYAMQTNLCW